MLGCATNLRGPEGMQITRYEEPNSFEIARQMYLKKGLAEEEAARKAKKLVMRLKQVKRLKQEGYGSQEAMSFARYKRIASRMKKRLEKIGPELKATNREALALYEFYRAFLAIAPKSKPSLDKFLQSYIKHRGSTYMGALQVDEALQKTSEEFGVNNTIDLFDVAGYSLYAPNTIVATASAGNFFSRSLRAIKEGRIKTAAAQQDFLEETLAHIIPLHPYFSEKLWLKVLRLRKPLKSPETNVSLRTRRELTPQEEHNIRLAIARERRSDKLGKELADYLLQNYKNYKENKTRPASEQFLPSLSNLIDWDPIDEVLKAAGTPNYLNECLANPVNKKFLAQKAIEWYRKRR